MVIISLRILEEEDDISIDSDINCAIYAYMPRKRFSKKKDGASKSELALEPASELYSGERGDAEAVEAEVTEFIDDYVNDEYERTVESPP